MAEIFRKSALEKLSSPEQLDKAIVIVSPSFWLAMLGALGIIIAALLWSIFGKLPRNVSANGIFMNRAGIHTVYSEVAGTVEELTVYTGQKVHKGEVIARLSSEREDKKLSQLIARRKAVEAVTFTSADDEATDDNKALLDIKSQALTMDSPLVSDRYLLDARQDELASQRGKTASAKSELEELEIKYYLTLLPIDTNKANLTMQDAQTNLNSAKNYLESTKSTLLSLEAQNENTEAKYRQMKEMLEEANETDEGYSELLAEYEKAKWAYEDYEDAADEYEHSIRSWESVTAQMQSQYDAAKEGQIQQTVMQESMQAYNAQVNTAYQRALSDYSNELSTQRGLEDEIIQLKAKMAGEEDDIVKQNSALSAQFDAAKKAAIAQLDREITEYNEQIINDSICSTLDGTITELSVVEGQVIAAGEYVARVSQGDDEDNVVVCYLPLADGRKIKAGMSASVYPSTANKQEYGHMRGTVEYVDEYVTSRAEITNQVGVTSLVESFLSNGPVVEVRIILDKDDTTESGYWWSSRRGAELDLMKGTIVSADIATEEKAPISMLVPYLKEKLTVERAGKTAGQ